MTDLQVNQSALTGESNPIYKSDQADLDPEKTELEYDNMVFAGTTVSSGSGCFYSICYRNGNRGLDKLRI